MKLTMACLVAAGTALAHHSLHATYNFDKQVELTGKIAAFMLRNSHSYIQIESPDETGQMRRWMIEWGSGGQLGAQGIRRDTLHAGEEVTITMMPGKVPADQHRGVLKTLRRPADGYEWGTKPGEVVTAGEVVTEWRVNSK